MTNSHPLDGLKLPRLISDGMVLQRQTNINIWGWANSEEPITVHFAGKQYETSTNAEGIWTITLTPLEAGGPYHMEVSGRTSHMTIQNILIGDVWVTSGQSNMVIPMARVKDLYA